MKLWIDDVRPAPDGYIWCKSVNESKEYIEPMPKLEVGMMVHVKYTDGEVAGLGIIREYQNKLIITYYEDGAFDDVDDEDVIIDEIYDAPSFLYADNNSKECIIWRKN